jgi:hypothetical protein
MAGTGLSAPTKNQIPEWSLRYAQTPKTKNRQVFCSASIPCASRMAAAMRPLYNGGFAPGKGGTPFFPVVLGLAFILQP